MTRMSILTSDTTTEFGDVQTGQVAFMAEQNIQNNIESKLPTQLKND